MKKPTSYGVVYGILGKLFQVIKVKILLSNDINMSYN